MESSTKVRLAALFVLGTLPLTFTYALIVNAISPVTFYYFRKTLPQPCSNFPRIIRDCGHALRTGEMP